MPEHRFFHGKLLLQESLKDSTIMYPELYKDIVGFCALALLGISEHDKEEGMKGLRTLLGEGVELDYFNKGQFMDIFWTKEERNCWQYVGRILRSSRLYHRTFQAYNEVFDVSVN